MQRLGIGKFQRRLGATKINRRYVGATRIHGVDPPAPFYSYTGSAYTDDANASGTATLTAQFQVDGRITFIASTGDGGGLSWTITHWHDGGTVSGIGNSRWAKKTLVSGDVTTGTVLTSLTALTAIRTMVISLVAGEAREGTYLVEIYSDSGGINKVGEVVLTMTVAP